MMLQFSPNQNFYRSSVLALVSAVVLAGAISAPAFAGSSTINDEPTIGHEKEKKKETTAGKTGAKPEMAELTKTIELLEERIRTLEERLARLDRETPAIAALSAVEKKPDVPAEIKIEIQDLKEEVKKDEAVTSFFRSVEVNGLIDGYYSYNNNRVDMFTEGRAFDVRHNAFSLQLAKLTLERKNSKDNPLGFRIDLGLGETVDRVISVSDAERNNATKHILQAYASYVAPVGSGLTLDFGKFYTPIGAEVIETKDNFNYSRGLLFTFGPYYHTGLRARYGINDKVAVTGFLVNGWDNLFENNVSRNAGKTLGVQLALTPVSKLALTGTYLGGQEAPLANVPAVSARDNWRNIFDVVATYHVSEKLRLLGNFVYGNDGDNFGNRGYWTGFAGYFKYSFNHRFAFSPRFEVLNDREGLRTGRAQTIKDITLTQEVKLLDSLVTRFEFRRDFSNREFFTNIDGLRKNNQNSFIVGVSYFFSTRGQ